MGEPYRTWAEIEKAYPNEWVLLDKLTTRRSGRVTGGVVVAHAPDRDEFYRLWDLARPIKEGAVRYTGKEPDDEIELFDPPADGR